MRRAVGLTLAALVAAASTAAAEPVRAGPPMAPGPIVHRPPPFRIGPRPDLHRRRFGFDPIVRRRVPPDGPPPLPPAPPAGEILPPDGPGLSPPIEGSPETLPALAHGFHLDVKVGAGRSFDAPPTLNRFVEVGQALGRCFQSPAGLAWGSVTLRVAFKRDGSVFGLPRVPYSDAATPDQKTELARSLLAGLKSCTPLPMSPSLGAAVAGEIFAIRFIHEDHR